VQARLLVLCGVLDSAERRDARARSCAMPALPAAIVSPVHFVGQAFAADEGRTTGFCGLGIQATPHVAHQRLSVCLVLLCGLLPQGKCKHSCGHSECRLMCMIQPPSLHGAEAALSRKPLQARAALRTTDSQRQVSPAVADILYRCYPACMAGLTRYASQPLCTL